MESLAPKREIGSLVAIDSDDGSKMKCSPGELMLVPSWTLPHHPLAISPTCPRHGPVLQMALRGGTLLDGLPGDAYTIKLAFTLGLCKLLCGMVTVVLGMAALVLQATLGGIGAGMWAGMVTLVAGIVGMLSSRLPNNYAMLIAFLCWSITSLATSALLAVFSTTGLTKDLATVHSSVFNHTVPDPLTNSTEPDDFVIETAWFPEPLYLSVFPARRAATIANAALVTLAVVDCLLSIACVTLVGSEACSCSNGAPKAGAWGIRAERKTRQDRLLNWLDQQHIQLFVQHCSPNPRKSAIPCLVPEGMNGFPACGSDSSPTPCQSYVSRDTLDSAITTKSMLERRVVPSRNMDGMSTDVEGASTRSQLNHVLAEDLITKSHVQDRY